MVDPEIQRRLPPAQAHTPAERLREPPGRPTSLFGASGHARFAGLAGLD